MQNRIATAGLSIEAWAARAYARLASEGSVVRARLAARRGAGVDDEQVRWLEVDVVLDAADRESAVHAIKRAIYEAMADVAGDREIGWSEYEWEAGVCDARGMDRVFPSPEAAARSDDPNGEVSEVRLVSQSPDGQHAVVLLEYNASQPYAGLCQRRGDGWVAASGGSAGGETWLSVGGDASVHTVWDPPSASWH